MLAAHKSVIPPYDGKPFVLRDTMLTVSHLTGTGSKRNPWHVVVTDGTHFWHLEPDDVVRVETEGSASHSVVKRGGSKSSALAVGDLVAPLGSKAEIFRVAEKYPQPGYVRVLPYQRGGGDQVLFRTKRRGRQVWTDGQVEWIWMGNAS